MFGRRSLVAKVDERVLHERVIDDVDRHGPTLYNFSTECVHTTRAVVAIAARSRSPCLAAQQARRPASLVVIGGTVITENATRQVLSPGAVAIDGTDILDVDSPEVDRRPLQRGGDHRRARSGRAARI